jgi:hypothetical protein
MTENWRRGVEAQLDVAALGVELGHAEAGDTSLGSWRV